jgi:hypothetical protein
VVEIIVGELYDENSGEPSGIVLTKENTSSGYIIRIKHAGVSKRELSCLEVNAGIEQAILFAEQDREKGAY